VNRFSKWWNLRRTAFIVVILLLAYVGSYAILSRRGMAQSKAMGYEGLYFFPPEDTDSWRTWNFGCVIFYYPLIVVESWLGMVDGVGCEPLWRLSARRWRTGGDPGRFHDVRLRKARPRQHGTVAERVAACRCGP
jgi:hypothetical protein